MNKLTNTALGTQLSTVVAAILTYVAHLIGSGSILNDNWNFMIYINLGLAMLFMILPYLCLDKEYVSHDDYMDTCKLIEECFNEPVIEPDEYRIK